MSEKINKQTNQPTINHAMLNNTLIAGRLEIMLEIHQSHVYFRSLNYFIAISNQKPNKNNKTD